MAQDIGTMKIKTKLYNKEFFEVIEVLKGNDPNVEQESTMQNTHAITDEDEIEQERKNKIKAMRDAKLDYGLLTKGALSRCGYLRTASDSAVKFLQARSGSGAWGHVTPSTAEHRHKFGRIGFEKPRLQSAMMNR